MKGSRFGFNGWRVLASLAFVAVGGLVPGVKALHADSPPLLNVSDFYIAHHMEQIQNACVGEAVELNVYCTYDIDQLGEQIQPGYTIESCFTFWFAEGSEGVVITPSGGTTGWTSNPIWFFYGACSFSKTGLQEIWVKAEARIRNPNGQIVGQASAEKAAYINIYRPDTVLEGAENEFMDETVEEARGSYFTAGKVKRFRLQFEGIPPDNDPNLRIELQCSRGNVYTNIECTDLLDEWQWTLAAMPTGYLYLKAGETCSSTDKGDFVQMSAVTYWPCVEYPWESRGGSDSAKTTMFKIDLDWADCSDDAEAETGLYIPLNDDNDDSDTWIDCHQLDTTVLGEDETRRLIIRRPTPVDLPGTILLTRDTIRTVSWTEQSKGTQMTQSAFSISGDLSSDYGFWIEGTSISVEPRNVEYCISYTPPDNSTTSQDIVKATVFKPDLCFQGLDESEEEETGLFIATGAAKVGDICVKENLVPGTEIYLSWGGGISLYDCATGEALSSNPYTYIYQPGFHETFIVKGDTLSSECRDSSVAITTACGGWDTVKVTVFEIIVLSDADLICAGGDDRPDCRTNVTAFLIPPIEGKTVNFSIDGDLVEDDVLGYDDPTYYYDVGNSDGTLADVTGSQSGLTTIAATTNVDGQATVILCSGSDASNAETYLYFYGVVKAVCDTTASDSTSVEYKPPDQLLEPFLDPVTGLALDELSEGETSLNRLTLTSCVDNAPVANHTIQWEFRFWDLTTLDYVAQHDPYNAADFDSLTEAQQEEVFANTPADYSGYGDDRADYGKIVDAESQLIYSTVTNSEGVTEAYYLCGSHDGYVEIDAEDTNIQVAVRR